MDPGVDYGTITVKAGGIIVFKPNVDLNLRAKYIHLVNGGELHIGADDCPHVGQATITLLGK